LGRRARVGIVGILLHLTLAQTSTVWASTFSVNPVQVVLSGRTKSALLTLKNTSSDPLRFQLSVAAWDQSAQGEMLLKPTRDIVFFPQLVTLAAGEERKVRVGTVIPPGPAERTYRIFIEELPPRGTPEPSEPGAQVRVLTKMGIPIFLQPANTVAEGRIQGLGVARGRLSFQVKNTGNVHFSVQAIRITGSGAAGEPVLQGELRGWYVLAGGTRIYEFEMPRAECAKIAALSLEVQTTQKALSERLDLPPGACEQ
jgi:fimbrial chaperone protein